MQKIELKREILYYIRIGKDIEHRTYYSKYDPNGDYGLDEARIHASEARIRLSTGRRQVYVERETVIVEQLF